MTMVYNRTIAVLLGLTIATSIISIVGYILKVIILPELDTSSIENYLSQTFILLTIVLALLIGVSAIGYERTAAIFILTFIISFLFELSSTYNGFPYGKYEYTDRMGYKLLGEVPILIPLSWFSIILPSYLIGHRLGYRGWNLVIVSSIFVLFWDLSLEYMASYIQKFWIWESGFFYGMPIENWGGWLLTAFIIHSLFYLLFGDEKINYSKNALLLYLTITLFSAIFSIVSGGLLPGLLTVGGILIIILSSIYRGGKIW
ncbi:MAG: carotenoid biosynthesis protein [Spirochaetia bacterium]|nr:carotenoid biosynthesis protein [Spirochaetota bacterium]MDW8111907.1 carotenoid biosynthesis protein [Spirochaetia bacterium]